MNFDRVIFAHSNWKIRFRQYLEGQAPLEQHEAERDDVCELGQWIKQEGQVYAKLPEMADLQEKHAHFHHVVAQVLKAAQALPREQALALVDVGTDYARASAACVHAISTLKHLLGESRRPISVNNV